MNELLKKFSPKTQVEIPPPILSEHLEDATEWHNFVIRRSKELQSIYPEKQIALSLPSTQNVGVFLAVMEKSREQIYSAIGPKNFENSQYRQTDPKEALYAAIMTQAIAQVEGVSLKPQVLDLGSGDGVLGLAFALCGFDVVGVEQDRWINQCAIKNFNLLKQLQVKFKRPILFINGDYNKHKDFYERAVWVAWPWPNEIDSLRKLFLDKAPTDSLLVTLSMGRDILEYLGQHSFEAQRYLTRLRDLGSRLNWRQAGFDDFFEAQLGEWGHLGGYKALKTMNDNWCILLKK